MTQAVTLTEAEADFITRLRGLSEDQRARVTAFADQEGEAQAKQDHPLDRFLHECLYVAKNSRVKSQTLYQVYCRWCHHREIRPMNQVRFAQGLRERGYRKDYSRQVTGYPGLAFAPFATIIDPRLADQQESAR